MVALGMLFSIFFLPVLLSLVSGVILLLLLSGPGLPLLSNLAGPVQHFRAAILDAWRNRVAAGLCGRAGFRSGPLLDFHGSLQLLNSSHVRERDKALLRSIMVGGVWNGFLLEKLGSILLLVGSLVLLMEMVTSFQNVPFLLLLRFVKVLNFMIL